MKRQRHTSRGQRAAREHKRLDPGNRTLSTMPWKIESTFGPVNDILLKIETTGDIEHGQFGAVYMPPSKHEWFDLAPAIAGFAQFYDLHAQLCGRDMPTASLHQLANKFRYGMMLFQSDIDAVRADLAILEAETLPMTENYATAIIQTIKEAP